MTRGILGLGECPTASAWQRPFDGWAASCNAAEERYMPERWEVRTSIPQRLGVLWRRLVHDSPTWPIHESYRCRGRGRSFPIPWPSNARSIRPRSYSTNRTRRRKQRLTKQNDQEGI